MTFCRGAKLTELWCILDAKNQHSVRKCADIYASLLRECINMKALAEGKRVHDHIIRNGYNSSIFLMNVIINMYAKCGCMDDACQLFNSMPKRDLVSWNVMLAAYARHGRDEEAFKTFWAMQEKGMKPNKFTFISILKVCASQGNLAQGKQIHYLVIENGCETDVFVGSTLINMYSKCGSIVDAEQLFERMRMRNLVCWNAMLAGYAQHGHATNAIKLFQQMQWEGLVPDKFTFIAILDACATDAALELGKQIHAHIINARCESDIFIANTLVNMYAKCGSLEDAQLVFKRMNFRNVVTWNTMIAGYIQHGQNDEGLKIFWQMQQQGVNPDKLTFMSILNACTGLAALEQGKQIHRILLKCGIKWPVSVWNSLMNMYAKCGSLSDVCQVFNRMPERDLISWNIVISGHAQQGQEMKAFDFYQQLRSNGLQQPDRITYAAILDACISLKALDEGRQIHIQIIKSELDSDAFVGNLLVNMYAKCGSLVDALEVLVKMPKRDVVSWNTLIAGYAHSGHPEEAYKLFLQMQEEGIKPNMVTFIIVLNICARLVILEQGKQIHHQIVQSNCELDVSVWNMLVDMYAKCGSMKDACQVFEEMPKRDTVSWNVIISGYVHQGYDEDAVRIYHQMQHEGVKADQYTFVSVLKACCNLAAVEEGKQVHADIIRSCLESDVFVSSTLISMYAKCGSVGIARQVFDKMPEPCAIQWTGMIAGYAQNGHAQDALTIFWQMQQEGVKPDAGAFVGVLSACNHAGLVDEGYRYFDTMCQDHGIMPTVQHYVCMVDLLGRAGDLQEAEYLIQKMPFQPSSLVWIAVLGNSRAHGNLETARFATECILVLEPDNYSAFVLVSNLYAAAGQWNKKWNLRRIMDDKDAKSSVCICQVRCP